MRQTCAWMFHFTRCRWTCRSLQLEGGRHSCSNWWLAAAYVRTTAVMSMDIFQLVTEANVRRVIMASPSKSSSLDPILTFLLKEVIDVLPPIITALINASLSQGRLPMLQKQALVMPLLKKAGHMDSGHGQLQGCLCPTWPFCRRQSSVLSPSSWTDTWRRMVYYRGYSPLIDAVILWKWRCYVSCPMFSQPPTRSVWHYWRYWTSAWRLTASTTTSYWCICSGSSVCLDRFSAGFCHS